MLPKKMVDPFLKRFITTTGNSGAIVGGTPLTLVVLNPAHYICHVNDPAIVKFAWEFYGDIVEKPSDWMPPGIRGNRD